MDATDPQAPPTCTACLAVLDWRTAAYVPAGDGRCKRCYQRDQRAAMAWGKSYAVPRHILDGVPPRAARRQRWQDLVRRAYHERRWPGQPTRPEAVTP